MNAQSIIAALYQKGAALRVDDGALLIDAPDGVLDDALLAGLRQHKQDIIALLAALDGAPAARPLRRDWPPSYQCATSLAQQRMLFLEELAGGHSYYNIPVAYDIDGPLDKAALASAFAHLAATHDILRAVYALEDQRYLQNVGAPAPLAMREFDLAGAANLQADLQADLQTLLAAEADHRFDLRSEWPIRVALIALGAERHVLAINIHHIAADGASARRIAADLGAAYRACRAGAGGEAPPSRPYQYADYVAWQDGWRASSQYGAARDYWCAALAGAPQLHSLPTDFIRPSVQTTAGATHVRPLGAALRDAVEQAARAWQSTPFVILQCGFAALLARYSGESDIVFGTAAANRQPLEFADAVGLFVNTLALRYQVADEASFADLVAQGRQVSGDAFRHQQFPFDALVDELQPARSLGYNPLVQLMLVMQDGDGAQLALDGTHTSALPQRQPVSKFDLALHVHAAGGEYGCHWEFNTSLFKPDTIAALAAHFEQLLAACLAEPQRAIGAIALVEAGTEPALQAQDHPPAQCVHRLFEQQAALRPAAPALLDGGATLSYAELDRRAAALATHLQAAGGAPGAPIGVCMEKTAELVVCMLAIFKIGAVYVPLDPHYPQERLAFMIEDSGMALMLTGDGSALPASAAQHAALLDVRTLTQAIPGVALPQCSDAEAGAYIIYTSGSTGKPKGVLVRQCNLFHSLRANAAMMDFSHQDVMPTIGSQAFGASLLEILLPLVSGGAVQLMKKAQVADLQQLVAAGAPVTVLHAVPSLMRQWLDAVEAAGADAVYPGLRLLLVGGEAVPAGLLKRIQAWRPALRLVALYGMTEAAIVCSSFEPGRGAMAHYCIGKPYASSRFYVLNRHGQRQPRGVPGELHIGGLAVAAGYVNQPGMTAERFVSAPLLGGERLYKTGDRVRLQDDGNYEFMGRVDHQVSLRGARIEMGEIEALAGAVAGVKQAIANVATLGEDEQTLVLYYTASDADSAPGATAQRIREHLARHLPDYMRPSLVQALDAFPLNPNGKVDRKRLPRPQLDVAIVEAATDIERQLAQIWMALLQAEQVSVTASFFEMGGHSLLATRMVAQIRARFEIAFPLAGLFAAPTIRNCALLVEQGLREKYAHSLVRADGADVAADAEEMLI